MNEKTTLDTLENRKSELEKDLAAAEETLQANRAALVAGNGAAEAVAQAESRVRALKDASATVESEIATEREKEAAAARQETHRQNLNQCEAAARSFLETTANFYKQLDEDSQRILQSAFNLAKQREQIAREKKEFVAAMKTLLPELAQLPYLPMNEASGVREQLAGALDALQSRGVDFGGCGVNGYDFVKQDWHETIFTPENLTREKEFLFGTVKSARFVTEAGGDFFIANGHKVGIQKS
jgi:FtsZ-interacting cell division protein ZipA